jgi:hypothetical protein
MSDTLPLAGRWTRRPTARGVGTAILGGALLAAGIEWRYPGVLGLGGALLAMAVLGYLTVLGRAPVSVRRSVWPLEVTRFEPCGATLRIRRSRGLLAAGVEAVEHVAGRRVPVQVPRLASGGTAEIGYPIPTERRGLLVIGPLDVRRRALAGLAESRAALGGTVQVRVLPRILPVHGMPSGVRRGHAGADERVQYGGTDLVGLREYVPGDDLRRLHWATSARTGTLMVREDADPSLAHLTVLLDDRAGSYPGADMEEAIEVAASLAMAAANSDHGVRLLTVCDQLDITHLATPGAPSGRASGAGGNSGRASGAGGNSGRASGAGGNSGRASGAGGNSGLSARSLVSGLAEVAAQDTDRESGPIPVSALDIVVVVTGATADLGSLTAEAGRAAVGMVAVVDPDPTGPPVVAVGPVTVLRGQTSERLLGVWESVVAA